MFSDPEKNLKTLGLHENSIVADLGAGTGFYSVLAGKMAPAGKVYAVEVQKDYLTAIRARLAEAGVSNVECLWGNIEKVGGTKLRDRIVDVAIASNVLFQVEDKEKFIDEVKRILKPGGRVLLIDWTGASPLGPKGNMVVSKDAARGMFEKKGFIFDREVDAGAHHYGMIIRKQ